MSQSGHHSPIGPGRLRLPDLTTQNLDLMPQRDYLDVVRFVTRRKSTRHYPDRPGYGNLLQQRSPRGEDVLE
jgi:hypothetical protein